MLSRFLAESAIRFGSKSLKPAQKLILASELAAKDEEQKQLLSRLLNASAEQEKLFTSYDPIGSPSIIPAAFLEMLEDIELQPDQPRLFHAPLGAGMKDFFQLCQIFANCARKKS